MNNLLHCFIKIFFPLKMLVITVKPVFWRNKNLADLCLQVIPLPSSRILIDENLFLLSIYPKSPLKGVNFHIRPGFKHFNIFLYLSLMI